MLSSRHTFFLYFLICFSKQTLGKIEDFSSTYEQDNALFKESGPSPNSRDNDDEDGTATTDSNNGSASKDVVARVIKLNGKLRSVYLRGDMILSGALRRSLGLEKSTDSHVRTKRWAYKDIFYPDTIWSDGVPYAFDAQLSPLAITSLKNAIAFWQSNTCVTFRERDNETQYILFTGENEGCFSSVGRDTEQPEQPVNIGRGCYHFGVTTHEIGHALGLFHHQQRYDRDDYISFIQENVPRNYLRNFVKIPERFLSTYGLPYDVGSIMHYTPTEFAPDRYLPGLVTIDPNLQGTMGALDGPSFLDVEIINRHYQCDRLCNSTDSEPTCLNGGYVDPLNCTVCKCPTGFAGDFCQLIEPSGGLKCGGLIPTTSKLTRMKITIAATGPARRKCVYHIRSPPNRRVMIGLQEIRGVCQEGCYNTAVEMKMIGDFRPVGYRFCCNSHSFRRMLSRGRNVPITFFARNSTLEVILYFRWVVLTPDAEDARYLNATQLAEVYTQSDADNGVDMQLLQLPYEPVVGSKTIRNTSDLRVLKKNTRIAYDDPRIVGAYGSNGESYEDFSVYS